MAKQTALMKWTDAVRGILLATASLALITLLVWNYFTPTVKALGNLMIQAHKGDYKEALDEIDTDKVASNEKITKLKAIILELDSTTKEESLGRIKRRAFELLTSELKEREEYEECLKWLDKWLSYDDHNLFVIYARIEVMRKIQGRSDEAFAVAEKWYKKAPEIKMFRDEYASMLQLRGRMKEAEKVALPPVPVDIMYRKPGNKSFERFHGRSYSDISGSGSIREFEYGISLNSKIDALSIVFDGDEQGQQYKVNGIEITYTNGGMTNTATGDNPRLHDMKVVNDWLVVEGSTPMAEFHLKSLSGVVRKIVVYGSVK